MRERPRICRTSEQRTPVFLLPLVRNERGACELSTISRIMARDTFEFKSTTRLDNARHPWSTLVPAVFFRFFLWWFYIIFRAIVEKD